MINQPTIEQLIDEITLQKQTKMRIDSLSRALIQNLYIPYCGDLYFHLKLTKACDNHTAIKRPHCQNSCHPYLNQATKTSEGLTRVDKRTGLRAVG